MYGKAIESNFGGVLKYFSLHQSLHDLWYLIIQHYKCRSVNNKSLFLEVGIFYKNL